MKVGFMVMIQKQGNNRSGRAHSHQEQKGTAGLEFNRACSLFFYYVKGIVRHEFDPPNTTVNS
jgi:hypothetical protein